VGDQPEGAGREATRPSGSIQPRRPTSMPTSRVFRHDPESGCWELDVDLARCQEKTSLLSSSGVLFPLILPVTSVYRPHPFHALAGMSIAQIKNLQRRLANLGRRRWRN